MSVLPTLNNNFEKMVTEKTEVLRPVSDALINKTPMDTVNASIQTQAPSYVEFFKFIFGFKGQQRSTPPEVEKVEKEVESVDSGNDRRALKAEMKDFLA